MAGGMKVEEQEITRKVNEENKNEGAGDSWEIVVKQRKRSSDDKQSA